MSGSRVWGVVLLAVSLGWLAVGCSAAQEVNPSPTAFAVPSLTAVPTLRPTTTWTTVPLPTQTSTPEPQVCSPLDGKPLSDLPGRVVNPYHPPEPGSDDPHQGADLAELKPGTQIAQAGLPVHFVLDGSVAAVIHDRFPYGNAVLIETDLKDVAPNLGLAFPDPLSAPLQQTVLTCPPVTLPADFAQRPRSLYLLYAHLQEYETLAVGDRVTCGQTLGKIGSSGNAMNPHLHLEARIGPAGMTFDSMAHYDVSASEVEMGNYCLWRVSGWFQHIDPMCLLENCGKEGQ